MLYFISNYPINILSFKFLNLFGIFVCTINGKLVQMYTYGGIFSKNYFLKWSKTYFQNAYLSYSITLLPVIRYVGSFSKIMIIVKLLLLDIF